MLHTIEEPGGLQSRGFKESDTTEQLTHTHTHTHTLSLSLSLTSKTSQLSSVAKEGSGNSQKVNLKNHSSVHVITLLRIFQWLSRTIKWGLNPLASRACYNQDPAYSQALAWPLASLQFFNPGWATPESSLPAFPSMPSQSLPSLFVCPHLLFKANLRCYLLRETFPDSHFWMISTRFYFILWHLPLSIFSLSVSPVNPFGLNASQGKNTASSFHPLCSWLRGIMSIKLQ